MADMSGGDRTGETVTVRYWAGARAAAGTAEDTFAVEGDLTLADVVALVLERHPDDRMVRTVAVCSVLVDGRAVGRDAEVGPDTVIEVLPPFAGG